MIQPCLKNRKEYKVVVLNGKASHVLPQKANGVVVKGGKGFSDAPHADLFRFAETGVERLSQICAGTISDFIIRVDVMQRANGNVSSLQIFNQDSFKVTDNNQRLLIKQ